MATTTPVFLRLWRDDSVRSTLLEHMDTSSICALRLASIECSILTTPVLFTRTRLTFTPSALTRPSRLEALSRIGHYIEHLIFSMPHTNATFLPPLLNPVSGREVNFLYTPHTSQASVTQRPKYGCSELGDLLTQQYPPIFHAATNVPAFINALSRLPNLRHLTISCPGQDPAQRYRRDAVDYALISLRIAIERNSLPKLAKLSLNHIHPSSLQYLRHTPGYGCTPSAGRRWKQIRKLNITMDAWDFQSPTQSGRDHLKILDDYIRNFSPNLEKVSFGWNGRKGPCPFTLFSDPIFAPPRESTKLFGEVTSPMSPLPTPPRREAMQFPKLRNMQVRNATMSVEQVAGFVLEHRHTVKEFDFENVFLINDGIWEDALAPLARISGHDEWSSQVSASDSEGSFPSQEGLNQFYDLDELEEPDEVIDSQQRLTEGTLEDWPLSVHAPNVLVKKKTRHRRRRRKHHHHRHHNTDEEPTSNASKLVISAPIPIEGPIEDVLMPVAFNPQGRLQPTIYTPASHSHLPLPPHLPHSHSHTHLQPNIQGVQRNVFLEAAQQELADDPEKRVSTLKKAKEAVLKQLGKEFCRTQSRKDSSVTRSNFFKNSCAARSGMFGAVGQGGMFGAVGSGGMFGAVERMGHESRTALVPLMFSRY